MISGAHEPQTGRGRGPSRGTLRTGSSLAQLTAALLATLGSIAPATAQSADVDTCVNEVAPALQIGACTRVIDYWGSANARLGWAYHHRANGYGDARDFDRAVRDYDIVIGLKPDDAPAHLDRGLAFEGKGDYGRAILDFDAAIRLDPGYAMAYDNRCYSLAVVGQARRALPDCDRALRLNRADPAALDSRGYAHLRLGRPDRAIADYTAALKIYPELDTSLFGRGVAYARTGNRQRAARDMAAARRINPEIDRDMAKVHLMAPAGL
jgi:tetratricopeptide (TPR) repeat protein